MQTPCKEIPTIYVYTVTSVTHLIVVQFTAVWLVRHTQHATTQLDGTLAPRRFVTSFPSNIRTVTFGFKAGLSRDLHIQTASLARAHCACPHVHTCWNGSRKLQVWHVHTAGMAHVITCTHAGMAHASLATLCTCAARHMHLHGPLACALSHDDIQSHLAAWAMQHSPDSPTMKHTDTLLALSTTHARHSYPHPQPRPHTHSHPRQHPHPHPPTYPHMPP